MPDWNKNYTCARRNEDLDLWYTGATFDICAGASTTHKNTHIHTRVHTPPPPPPPTHTLSHTHTHTHTLAHDYTWHTGPSAAAGTSGWGPTTHTLAHTTTIGIQAQVQQLARQAGGQPHTQPTQPSTHHPTHQTHIPQQSYNYPPQQLPHPQYQPSQYPQQSPHNQQQDSQKQQTQHLLSVQGLVPHLGGGSGGGGREGLLNVKHTHAHGRQGESRGNNAHACREEFPNVTHARSTGNTRRKQNRKHSFTQTRRQRIPLPTSFQK